MTEYRAFVLDQLEAQIPVMEGFVRHFPDAAWEWQPSETLWSARHHLIHLRDVERRYLTRLEGVLKDGAIDMPRAYGAVEETNETPQEVAADYAAIRRTEVGIFRGFSPQQWAITFEHGAIWGTISMEFWLERLLHHTLDHLQNLWMVRQMTQIAPEHLAKLLAG